MLHQRRGTNHAATNPPVCAQTGTGLRSQQTSHESCYSRFFTSNRERSDRSTSDHGKRGLSSSIENPSIGLLNVRLQLAAASNVSRESQTWSARCPDRSRMTNRMDTPDHAPIQDGMIVHVESDFQSFLPKFMTNRKKEVVTMREAVAQQDVETVRKVAHGMKGAGGSYGFDRVTEMAAIIEQTAKTGVLVGIEAELDRLAIYLEQVQVVFD